MKKPGLFEDFDFGYVIGILIGMWIAMANRDVYTEWWQPLAIVGLILVPVVVGLNALHRALWRKKNADGSE